MPSPYTESPARAGGASTLRSFHDLSTDTHRRLLDLDDRGLFAASADGRLTFANAALVRLLGDLRARDRRAGWIAPRRSTERPFWTIIASSIGIVSLDVWVVRPDGTRVPARARARAFRNARRDVVGFEGMLLPAIEAPHATERMRRLRARLARLSTHRAARVLEERRALARRLHDDIGQTVVVMQMELDRLAECFGSGHEHGAAGCSIEALRASAGDAMSLVRSLCSDLRESGDGLLDLPTLLDPLVVRLARRGRITSRVLTTGGRIQIEGRRALLVAEICREALTNVIRHAHATDVVVRVMHRGTHFSMSVGDNGRGFPAAAIEGRGAFGVIGMRERAQALRGFLQILREDERTIVSVSAPLRSSDVLAP